MGLEVTVARCGHVVFRSRGGLCWAVIASHRSRAMPMGRWGVILKEPVEALLVAAHWLDDREYVLV